MVAEIWASVISSFVDQLVALIKYLCVFICGGHHDSDRIAVLVMVSKAETTVL